MQTKYIDVYGDYVTIIRLTNDPDQNINDPAWPTAKFAGRVYYAHRVSDYLIKYIVESDAGKSYAYTGDFLVCRPYTREILILQRSVDYIKSQFSRVLIPDSNKDDYREVIVYGRYERGTPIEIYPDSPDNRMYMKILHDDGSVIFYYTKMALGHDAVAQRVTNITAFKRGLHVLQYS